MHWGEYRFLTQTPGLEKSLLFQNPGKALSSHWCSSIS